MFWLLILLICWPVIWFVMRGVGHFLQFAVVAFLALMMLHGLMGDAHFNQFGSWVVGLEQRWLP